jgi:hypothetical protein
MKDRDQSRLASILSLLVGIWVVISPIWIPVSGAALVSVVVVGIIMIIAATLQFLVDVALPSWIVAIAAVWLLLSTFAFEVSTAAMYNQILSALIAFVLAYWDGMEIAHIEARRHVPMP